MVGTRKSSYLYHNPNTAETKAKILKDPVKSPWFSLSCLKFSLYMYNILALLCGLGVLAISLWIILDRDQVVTPYSSTYTLLAWVILGLGCCIIFSTVVGCCGISRESWLLVTSYSVACGFMIVIEITGGATAYVYRQDVHQELVHTLNSTVTQSYGLTPDTSRVLDVLQSSLHCCGAESFEDWRLSEWSRDPELRGYNKVPDSCCKTLTRQCGVRDHPSNIYYTGCAHALSALASRHLLLLGSVAGGVALVQLVGLLLACSLGHRLRQLED